MGWYPQDQLQNRYLAYVVAHLRVDPSCTNLSILRQSEIFVYHKKSTKVSLNSLLLISKRFR